jgi:hypothetical protein
MCDQSTEIQTLKSAVNLALNDDWHAAHQVAQDSTHLLAHWIHAVLHKIEGDEWNSRYWYRRAGRQYEDYLDPRVELQAILQELEA